MISTADKTVSQLPAAIHRRLDALRRAVRAWLVVAGARTLVLAVTGFTFGTLIIDRWARMDRPQRALCLCGGVAMFAFVIWRRLLRPLLRPLSNRALSAAAEAAHPELADRLRAAVDLALDHDTLPDSTSAAMVKATIEAAEHVVATTDLTGGVNRGRRNRNLLEAACAVALVCAAWLAVPQSMSLWFSRVVLLSNRQWPQRTELRIEGIRDGHIAVARGDDLTVRVTANPEKVVPSTVSLAYRQTDGRERGTERMVIVGEHRFEAVFRTVLAPFRFRAKGGDAETDWVDVRLVDRPAIASLTLTRTLPAYLGGAREALPAGMDVYRVEAGSTLEIEGRAGKPLATAVLQPAGHDVLPMHVVPPDGFEGRIAGGNLRSGVYSITVHDTDGLTTRRPARLAIRVVPDTAPVVRVRLEGISDMILPRAVLPLYGTVQDDHAVMAADVVLSAAGDDGAGLPAERQPIEVRAGRKVTLEHRIAAEPLNLRVGWRLAFHVEARDNDGVTGPKQGRSETFALRVVSDDELRGELLRREQEQRMEFERVVYDQRRLLEDVRVLQAAGTAKPAAGTEAAGKLEQAEKAQRLIGTRCMAIAAAFSQILAEAENNRLTMSTDGSISVRQRIEKRIILPLETIGRRDATQAADRLDAALGDSRAETAAALADAAAMQERLIAAMERILESMVRWEDYQQAVTLLQEVMKAQEEVKAETIKEQKRRIEAIFD